MKRLKEIKNQAYILSESVKRCNKDLGDVYEASFIEGAKWADKNPKDGMVNLDDVVYWLENNVNNYIFVDETSDTWLKIKSELFDDIRKAMEE